MWDLVWCSQTVGMKKQLFLTLQMYSVSAISGARIQNIDCNKVITIEGTFFIAHRLRLQRWLHGLLLSEPRGERMICLRLKDSQTRFFIEVDFLWLWANSCNDFVELLCFYPFVHFFGRVCFVVTCYCQVSHLFCLAEANQHQCVFFLSGYKYWFHHFKNRFSFFIHSFLLYQCFSNCFQ